MDSDDMLTPDTLSRVSRFFETHGDETDAVSIPMIYFDSKNEEHVLNDKFRAGERVIDLRTEWTAAQLSASSAFFKREALAGLEFDERLHYMEDAKFVHRVLSRKETLGAVPAASYLYRRRSGGQSSAAQGAVRDPRWYLPRLQYYFGDTIRYFTDSSGNVPRYVQFVMMYDIQWIFAMEDIPHGIERVTYAFLTFSVASMIS